MNKSFQVNFILRSDKADTRGLVPIYLRITVVTANGDIKRLKCPFLVLNKKDRKILQVKGITTGIDWEIYDQIENAYYRHGLFKII